MGKNVMRREGGKWVPSSSSSKTKASSTKKSTTTSKSSGSSKSSSRSSGSTKTGSRASTSKSSMTASTTNSKSSAGKAQKKSNKKVYYALSGTLKYVPGPRSIKLKAGNTVRLNGLGKYLNGNYYVGSVTRTLDVSKGLSLSAELYKPNFAKTLKTKKKKKASSKKSKKRKTSNKKSTKALRSASLLKTPAASSVSNKTPDIGLTTLAPEEKNVNNTGRVKIRTYTIQSRGDTPYTVALRFYGDGSKWTRMYYQKTGLRVDPKNFTIGTVICLP